MFSVPLTNQQVFSDDASTLSTGQREHPGIFSPATDHIQPPPPKSYWNSEAGSFIFAVH